MTSTPTFPDYEPERRAMLAHVGPSMCDLIERVPIGYARTICARSIEVERLQAARLPIMLPRDFGTTAAAVPFVAPRSTARAATATTNPRKKPTVTKQPDNYLARLDALEARLVRQLKSEGIPIPAAPKRTAAVSGTTPAINPGRKASCAELDRAFGGFTAQRASTRFNPATQTLELGVGNPTFRAPPPAPQAKPVSAARSSGTVTVGRAKETPQRAGEARAMVTRTQRELVMSYHPDDPFSSFGH